MKLKKNLVQLVQSDYTPLQTSAEGLLRGGFGSVVVGTASMGDLNIACNKNPQCKNTQCANPQCSNQCTINYCGPTTPTAAPSGLPTPTVTTQCIGF